MDKRLKVASGKVAVGGESDGISKNHRFEPARQNVDATKAQM